MRRILEEVLFMCKPVSLVTIVLTLLVLPAGMCGCSQENWDVVTSYSNDLNGQSHVHALAMELPDPLYGLHPVIVFIHGGWYATGDYRSFYSECHEAAQRGFIAISIDYHLTPYQGNTTGKVWPEQLDDAKMAVKWLRSDHAIYYKGSLYRLSQIIQTNAIGVAGESAGAHIALMMGLTNSTMDNRYYHYSPMSDVQAVCSMAGTTHFLSAYYESQGEGDPVSFIEALLEPDPVLAALVDFDDPCTFEYNCYSNTKTGACMQEIVPQGSIHPFGLLAYASPYYQSCPDAYNQCKSPIYNDVPIMMMIGTDDQTVPYASQHEPFFNKLAGPKEEVVYCKDQILCVCGHSFTFHITDRNERMFRFFNDRLP